MTKRIAASEATRERLQAVMDGNLDTADGRGELIRLAARLIVEEALEAEAGEALGRERYERVEGSAGYRNGLRTGRVATAEGMLEYSAPQLRDTPEPFVSAIRRSLKGRTQALEDLAVELYARGLSTRDIEKAFMGADGRPLIGRAAVSQITERLWADYEAFCQRDLSEFDIVYLFVDGIAERLRAGTPREAVIAAWGIGRTGCKALLGLMAGSKEDAETMRAFFHDLRARGLGDPLLVASDGAPGIVKAIEEGFPRTARQRCLAHRMRNLAAKACPGEGRGRRPTSGPSSRPGFRPHTGHLRGRSPAIWRRASPPITARACPARSSVSKTISRLVSRICACRSPTGAPSARQTCSRGCSARNAAG
jgi:putative transposase